MNRLFRNIHLFWKILSFTLARWSSVTCRNAGCQKYNSETDTSAEREAVIRCCSGSENFGCDHSLYWYICFHSTVASYSEPEWKYLGREWPYGCKPGAKTRDQPPWSCSPARAWQVLCLAWLPHTSTGWDCCASFMNRGSVRPFDLIIKQRTVHQPLKKLRQTDTVHEDMASNAV